MIVPVSVYVDSIAPWRIGAADTGTGGGPASAAEDADLPPQAVRLASAAAPRNDSAKRLKCEVLAIMSVLLMSPGVCFARPSKYRRHRACEAPATASRGPGRAVCAARRSKAPVRAPAADLG